MISQDGMIKPPFATGIQSSMLGQDGMIKPLFESGIQPSVLNGIGPANPIFGPRDQLFPSNTPFGVPWTRPNSL